MKKILLFVLAFAMIFVLAACNQQAPAQPGSSQPGSSQPSGSQGGGGSAPAKQNVTISFMASQDWVQDAEIELGNKFTEETGIKVDYQIVPSDQYFNLLMTKLNAGEATDLFGGQSGAFDIVSQYNVEKNAVNLSGEAWASTVDKLAAEQLSVNGKLYGQPMQDLSAVWAIAYNKNIFKQLNLEIPTNYDEFMKVCAAIKASGVTPIYECVADGWHHVLWFPEIGPAYEKAQPGLAQSLNDNKAKFSGNPIMTKALTQVKEMVDKGYWGDNYMSNEYANAPQNVASGKYAMVVKNQGFGEEVHAADANFSADDIGYFVIPLVDNQILNINPAGPSRFIYSGSKNVDAAKQYLAYIARPENLQYLIDNTPKFNTLAFTTAGNKYTPTIKEFYDRYSEKGTVYQVAVKYLNPQWMDLGKDLSAIFIGDMTPEQMLTAIDGRRADQAATAKDPAW